MYSIASVLYFVSILFVQQNINKRSTVVSGQLRRIVEQYNKANKYYSHKQKIYK